MKIPRISMKFKKLLHETAAAYLFLDWEKVNEIWIPKSICNIEKEDIHKVIVNVAPFKYTEMTGIIPQSLDELVIQEIESNLEYNIIPDYDIIEPKNIYLKEKQIEKIIKIKRLKNFFIYGQMRTGKTVLTSTIVESRYKAGLIGKVIIIAPLRVKKVWQAHLSIDFEFIAIEHFSNINTRDNINFTCDNNTFVCLDESHQIKNKGVLRTDILLKATENAGQKCILTGTPIGKHAGDLFYQFYFLDAGILNFYTYQDFSDYHLIYGGYCGKKVVAYQNIEEISQKISPYTVMMTRSEMDIDREKEYSIVSYYPDNYEEYSDLKLKYQEKVESKADNSILGYMVKLQQSANGFKFDNDDKIIEYIDNGRIECLKNILSQFDGESIVIYFKYNTDLQYLKNIDIPILSGKTSQTKFNETIDMFNNKEIKVIALQQQLSLGFSLKACDIMIYYSRKFGSISSAQSEDRACERMDIPLKIIDICAKNTIDEVIKSTINKQFDIINLFKKELKDEKK